MYKLIKFEDGSEGYVNHNVDVTTEDSLVVLGGAILISAAIMTIGSSITRIKNSHNQKKYFEFYRKNKNIVDTIEKTISSELSPFLKYMGGLKSRLTINCKELSKFNKYTSFEIDEDFEDTLQGKLDLENDNIFINQHDIIDIIKNAKIKKGKCDIYTKELLVISGGLDFDSLYDDMIEKNGYDWDDDNYYNKLNKSYDDYIKSFIETHSNDADIWRYEVDWDDYSTRIYFKHKFSIDLTEIHNLLQDIDISKLPK